MAEEMNQEENVITIGDKKFEVASLGEEAQAQLSKIYFINEQILNKNNELQISDSARIMYARALKDEVTKININTDQN